MRTFFWQALTLFYALFRWLLPLYMYRTSSFFFMRTPQHFFTSEKLTFFFILVPEIPWGGIGCVPLKTHILSFVEFLHIDIAPPLPELPKPVSQLVSFFLHLGGNGLFRCRKILSRLFFFSLYAFATLDWLPSCALVFTHPSYHHFDVDFVFFPSDWFHPPPVHVKAPFSISRFPKFVWCLL